jgi:hypothetical protein
MQVFDLIKTLTPIEIRDIRIILRSDWFNYRDDVRKLYDILVKEASHKQAILPEKSVLFEQIYPEKEKFDDKTIRLVASWLMSAIEDYFRWRAVNDDVVFSNTQLAAVYRNRNLPVLFHKKILAAQDALEKQPYRNVEYHRNLHELLTEEYLFIAVNKRTEAMNTQALGDALDIWFFAQKMRQVCNALSHQTVFKTEYKFDFLPTVLAYIEEKNLTEIPAICLYYYCYKALSQPENEIAFRVFRQKIESDGALFPDQELRDLYVFAINFCTKRVNAGSKAHIREGFELYRTGLSRGVFIVNGVLSRFTYRNAAALGLMLKELDWVADFLPRFQDFLEKPYRHSTYSFSLARLEYERKNLNSALQLLQNAEYEDILATLSAKVLILKILYEKEAQDALFSHIDAMRIFIKRHKEIGYHRDNYLNLLRFIQRLISLQKSDNEGLEKLKLNIKEETKLAEKVWLLEKMI